MEILSQIVGYIGTATAVVGFQVKARKHLLLCQIFSNLLVAFSFVLLGPDKLSGGAICFVAVFHTFFNYLHSKKGNAPPLWQTGIFFLIYTAVSAITLFTAGSFLFPLSLFPYFCSVLFILAITLKNDSLSRLCFFANASLWIFYDIFGTTFAVANLVTHILVLISNIIGIVRMDLLPKFSKK